MSDCVGAKFATGVDCGEDTGVGAIADDSTKLAAAGIDERITHQTAVVRAVVAQIGGDGAGAEVDFIANYRVAHIREVADR